MSKGNPEIHIHNPFQGMWPPLQALLIGVAFIFIAINYLSSNMSGFFVFAIGCILSIAALIKIFNHFGIGKT